MLLVLIKNQSILEKLSSLTEEREKSDSARFYNDIGGAGSYSWFSPGKTAWAEYLQLNSNQKGVDYFFERTLGKFDYEYLVEVEYLMCEKRIWDFEFCNTRPLTSAHKGKVPLRLDFDDKIGPPPLGINPRKLSEMLE